MTTREAEQQQMEEERRRMDLIERLVDRLRSEIDLVKGQQRETADLNLRLGTV